MVLTQAGNSIERDKGDEAEWESRCRFISASWVSSRSLLEVGLDSEGIIKQLISNQVFRSSFHLN